MATLQTRTAVVDSRQRGPNDPIIVFDHVSLAFDDTVVLRDVSFELRRGHTKIILGASGAGKSISLKLILGLLKPDAGKVWVNGQLVNDYTEEQMMKVRADIGMVFQEGALFDSLTVAENVGYKLYEETRSAARGHPEARRGSARLRSAVAVHRSEAVRAVGRAAAPCRHRARDDGEAAASCFTTSRRPVSIRLRRRRSTKKSSSCAISKKSPRFS